MIDEDLDCTWRYSLKNPPNFFERLIFSWFGLRRKSKDYPGDLLNVWRWGDPTYQFTGEITVRHKGEDQIFEYGFKQGQLALVTVRNN